MSGVQPRRMKPGGTVMGVGMSVPDQVYLLVRLEQGAGCLLRLDLEGSIRWRLDLRPWWAYTEERKQELAARLDEKTTG
ncbi:MAG TPA: hypothetical protein VKA46_32635 [Gemmataceae bacterium]|nr:hypothetical protein [Gemmataceae bacterium]